jgi:hypothetical protein
MHAYLYNPNGVLEATIAFKPEQKREKYTNQIL